MKKVLIITRHYLDEQLGGPNCSKAFVRALAEIYSDVTLIFPEHNDRKTDLYFLGKTNVRLLPCYDWRGKLQKCLDMYRGNVHRFGRLAEEEMRRGNYDIVFIDHSFTAASGVIEAAKKYAGKIVTLHHNVESEYIRDNQQSILFRLPYNHFSLQAEKAAVMTSVLNLTLTDDDAKRFAEIFPSVKDSFRTLGTFLFDEIEEMRLSEETEKVFVISGSLASLQTEIAMLSFIEDYLPVLNKVCPENKLIITGRNPSKRLQEICAGHKNISLIPNPEDILSEIRKGNFYIAPIHTGGGLKLRIMDGLRLGLPVIAHTKALRGYERIAADGAMFCYDDASSFESALTEMLKKNDASTHQRVAESFLRHFSFEAGKQRLEQILKNL